MKPAPNADSSEKPACCACGASSALVGETITAEQPSVLRAASIRPVPLLMLLAALGVPCAPRSAAAQPASQSPAGPSATPKREAHRELGAVAWSRDLDAALARSAQVDKPVLILFDEVPGCHTCVSYGQSVLRHPLVVEATEDLFVPLAIFNNQEGADRRALELFEEPAWNNPVVRIVDAQRRALAPRVNGDYTPAGLTGAMLAALKAANKPAPGYLKLYDAEASAQADSRTRTITFAMFCFWEGEAKLGGVEGVLSTRTGFVDGHEVVEVRYDPATASETGLVNLAKSMECASTVYCVDEEQRARVAKLVGGAAKVQRGTLTPSLKDDKYQMRHTEYARVPMTPAQASRVNAAVGRGQDPSQWLSPRQVELASAIRQKPAGPWPDALTAPNLAAAWEAAQQTKAALAAAR